MLNKAKTLKGYSIQSTDGETIGKVNEFYFDDRHWTIRYLVAETGTWLTNRQAHSRVTNSLRPDRVDTR